MNLNLAHCIVLKETPERTRRLTDHLATNGITPVLHEGINAVELGITTVNCYEVDHPGSGFIMEQKHTGLALSHMLLWRMLLGYHANYEHLVHVILEDDAEFVEGWRERLDGVMASVPDDFDMLLIGSCNCENKEKQEVAPGIFKIAQPQCTHAYIVKSKSLPKLIATQKRIWAPIDLALIFDSYPNMNVYTVLPRLVGQIGTHIEP